MQQVGYNTGPRHARALGLAKSYCRVLTKDQRVAHDQDVVGMACIFWAMIKAIAPVETTAPVEEEMDKAGIPRLATRDVAPGMLLHLAFIRHILTLLRTRV
jgi:hypothetical protein